MGQSTNWVDQQGNPVPRTESLQSKDGFGGVLILTSDADWRKKWDTPASTSPNFTTARTLKRGEPAFALILVSNPKLSNDGIADVSCDLEVLRPNGSSASRRTGVDCVKGRLVGGPGQVFMATPVINFVGKNADPSGQWAIRVSLTDNVRQTTLKLRTTFVLE